jgi:hypothetical protein
MAAAASRGAPTMDVEVSNSRDIDIETEDVVRTRLRDIQYEHDKDGRDNLVGSNSSSLDPGPV